jgi:hypothetical protein
MDVKDTCEQYSKWRFMMDWCKKNKFPPADFWKEAESAYYKTVDNIDKLSDYKPKSSEYLKKLRELQKKSENCKIEFGN